MRLIILTLITILLAGCSWTDWISKPEVPTMPAPPPAPAVAPEPEIIRQLCPPQPFTHSCGDRWPREFVETIKNIDKEDAYAIHMINRALENRADPETGAQGILDAIQAVRDIYEEPYEKVNEARKCSVMIDDGWSAAYHRCVRGPSELEKTP